MLDKKIIESLDKEIVDVIVGLNRLPYITTTNSCFGHPELELSSIPYVDITYSSDHCDAAISFHENLTKLVPGLEYRVLPFEYRDSPLQDVISHPDNIFHYAMYSRRDTENVKKFWDVWRKVLDNALQQHEGYGLNDIRKEIIG